MILVRVIIIIGISVVLMGFYDRCRRRRVRFVCLVDWCDFEGDCYGVMGGIVEWMIDDCYGFIYYIVMSGVFIFILIGFFGWIVFMRLNDIINDYYDYDYDYNYYFIYNN
jgi:putative component of toxin-antitoxin plasmid stabilization module